MGQLRNIARNTDITTRLKDPFMDGENDPKKSLQFHLAIGLIGKITVGILIAGTLLFCASKQALDLHSLTCVNSKTAPWMRNHHFSFFDNWSGKLRLQTKHENIAAHKAEQSTKNIKNKSHKVKANR